MDNVASLRIAINTGDVKTANSELDRLTKTSARTEQSANGVTKSFGGMSTAALGSVAAFTALGAGLSSFISTSGKFEQYSTSLKVLSGSAKEAEKNFAWVKDFTAKTPYTLDETMQAFIRLKAYGIDATSGSLKVLGDTASAMGKPLMSAVEAMADAMVGENERLKEFGIRASKEGDTIAYKWMDASGKTKTQIIQNNGEIIKSTLEAIFNEKYAGMMEEQAKTWVGAVSNLEDTWTSFKDTLARDSGAFELAKESVVGLNNALNGQNETINTLLPIAGSLAVTYGVMKTASIAATLTETLYAKAKTQTTIATNVSTASMITNMGVTRSLTTAQTAGAIASTALGTAMKAVPFVAVASTVAILAASFFDAKRQSDDLADSLSTTADKLAKLSQAQLAFKRQNISLELQDVTRQLTTKKLSAGATKGRSQEDQKEIDDLQDYVNTLKESSKEIAQAQTDIRNAKNGDAVGSKKIIAPREIAPIDKKAEAAAKKAAKEAERLAEEEADKARKFDHDITQGVLSNISRVTLARQEAEQDIEQSKDDAVSDNALRAAKIIEDIKTPLERLNESVLTDYDLVSKLFNEEQMASWFDHVNNEFANLKDNVNGMDFSSSIEFDPSAMEGTAKAVAGISKAMSQLSKAEAQYQKNKAITGATTEELQKNEEDHNKSQIAGYSDLAGSMSTFFEEGTKGAKAFQIVQSGLAVVNAVSGIAAQSSLPFPYNIAAMAGTAATVFSFLSAAGITGGGGGGSAPTISSKAMTESKIDIEQTSVVDRLDKQIKILESIDKNGSALSLSVELNTKTFNRDYDNFVNESLDKMFTNIYSSFGSGGGKHLSYIKTTEASIEDTLGFDLISSVNNSMAILNKESLKNGDNFISFLEGMANGLTSTSGLQTDWSAGGYEIFFDKDWQKEGLTPVVQAKKNISDFISEYQELVSEYTMSLIDSMDELTSVKESFEDSYDKITGTDFFQAKKLNEAYNDIYQLFDKTNISFEENLLSTIEIISKAEKFLSDESNLSSLLDYDPKNLQKQIETVRAFNEVVGVSVTSVEEVLNFVDSIELVADSMVSINDNIKSVFDDIQSFIDDLNSNSVSNPSTTFYTFTSSFNEMVDAIASGSSDLVEVGNIALDNAKNYLDVVKSTATAGRDVEFARAMLVNKFSGIIATPDTTLNTINGTLNANNQALLTELRSNKLELDEIKTLMASSNNYQKQISTNTQISRFIGA